MLSQDSFDSVHSPAPSIAEEEMEDEDDAMELLGNFTYCAYTTCVHMQVINESIPLQLQTINFF